MFDVFCVDVSCVIRYYMYNMYELLYVRVRFMYFDKLGWFILYMKIKMKVYNYEVFFNCFC